MILTQHHFVPTYRRAGARHGVRGELRSVAGVVEADIDGDAAADFRVLLANGVTAGAGDILV